ncbi:hypothetical protein AYO44_14760 [Planctomycetaceae bacterium SCGC AG-212-F19]|nr:hypothetical protein AYO44_14760 [Planctomycetaceae bacterium SCGC AG-212-F19]
MVEGTSEVAERQRILLLVEAEPGDWPGTVETRIRRAYKCLLRSYGVRIREHAATQLDRLPDGLTPAPKVEAESTALGPLGTGA